MPRGRAVRYYSLHTARPHDPYPMMNVLRAMFCGAASPEKGEVHNTVRRVFGEDLVMKNSTDPGNQRALYVGHVRDNLSKMLDNKTAGRNKSSRRSVSADAGALTDDRPGRIGPKIVVFDATTGTGRMILVGDERVSVQGLSNFATIRATACVFAGRWMFEMQLGTKGIMQVGWCTSDCSFSTDAGVGDTAHSYAYDGGRIRKWNVATSKYGEAWLAGDVIGSCIDLDVGTIEFYRNGVSLGVAFTKLHRGSGVAYFPAVSLAAQEHLYSNFGHVPFVFPVEGYSPLQVSPTRECARAALLLNSLDAVIKELLTLEGKQPTLNKSESAKVEGREVPLHIASSVTSPPPTRRTNNVTEEVMSKKAFLTSLSRIIVSELGLVLRMSYVVVSELLPHLRGALGLPTGSSGHPCDQRAAEYFAARQKEKFVDLSEKLRSVPQKRLSRTLDCLWSFTDESYACDVLEHCVVRECLLYDLVSPDMSFSRQQESVYVLCGLMQHTETRHHLVKYVLFGKIMFDNFLHIKCPDESVLKRVVRKPWWHRPTSVQGETDPRLTDSVLMDPQAAHKDPVSTAISASSSSPGVKSKGSKAKQSGPSDAELEKQYREDCDKISDAVLPLERIQVEFLLMLLDNEDGTDVIPSTRKIFMEKFRRYIMDNCILDMRVFNISRNSPAISWCCHTRLLTAVIGLWKEQHAGRSDIPPHVPPRKFIDGEMDFFNVDRLGGVLPYLVRTLRTELVQILGEDSVFIQSFEPHYNRGGGVDTGVSESLNINGSPALATLPQVISSIARFMNAPESAAGFNRYMSRLAGETSVALKGARSVMPGAGCLEPDSALHRLTDGLMALYHGAACKHAEKLCELRDNQMDMADCLHDIERRLANITAEMSMIEVDKLSEDEKGKHQNMESIVKELTRTKEIYEEKLTGSSYQLAWVIGAVWTRQRQQELAQHYAGALHTLRLASDPDYAAHVQATSKEILLEKSSLLPAVGDSYASLQLQYDSSSNQSPDSPIYPSATTTPRTGSEPLIGVNQSNQNGFSTALFAFTPEYYVDATLELCNTLRLFMHPTVSTSLIPGWEELLVSCASFLCSEFADSRVILASTRESIVQTLASFATQPYTMLAIERVPSKQQMLMVQELLRPYTGRAWAQSNWVLVRFWHGSGFGYRHRQWPHLAARYGDREPTIANLGAKVDAGLMSQCFGPCPSELIQARVREFLAANPEKTATFLNSLLSQLNWAFSEFINMLQEMDRVSADASLEPRQIKLCATCFDLYHGLARALEMTLHLAPYMLTRSDASDGQNELLLARVCQILMGVLSRVCSRQGGGAGFARLAARGLPDTDRVHHYVALAPVAGCLVQLLSPEHTADHLERVSRALVTEPLFRLDAVEFMVGRENNEAFSFYDYPDDVNKEELCALEAVIERLRVARGAHRVKSPPSSGSQSELLCTICYARPADTAFVPCRHHSCRSCIQQHLLNSKQCFFCKADIESVEEIEPTIT